MFRRRLVLLALPLLLAAPACSDDDGDQTVDASGTDTSLAVTVTTQPTVTTGPDSSTITTAAGPAGACAEDAAQRLYDAWVAGDEAAALAVAEQSAVDDLFAESHEPGFGLDSCRQSETVDNATECDYTDNAGTILTFLIEGNGEDGYRVTQLGFLEQ